MTDSSGSNSLNPNKRRLDEIDDTIEYLSHEITKLKDIVSKSELECSLMSAKLKREKVKALAAVAKSQIILSDMEILIIQSDLHSDLERLKKSKVFELDREGVESHPSTKSFVDRSTQTIVEEKKKKRIRCSKPNRKYPVDTHSSDETVLVETLDKKTEIVIESSQLLQLALPDKLQFDNISDSEISLSNSIKAEFNKPYSKTDTEEYRKRTHKKTHKSNKKAESKSSSTNVSKVTQQNQSSGIKTKTSDDVNKGHYSASNTRIMVSTPKNNRHKSRLEPYSYDKKTTPSTSTYIPCKHNLPSIMAPVRNLHVPTTTSEPSSSLFVNTAVTQSNIYSSSDKGVNGQNCNFYGSRQSN